MADERTQKPLKSLFIQGAKAQSIVAMIFIGLAVIGGLLAMIIPQVSGALNRAHLNQTKMAMQQIIQSINKYQEICQHTPDSLQELIDIKNCPEAKEPFLKKIPTDGWGHEFIFKFQNGMPILKTNYKGKEYWSNEL